MTGFLVDPDGDWSLPTSYAEYFSAKTSVGRAEVFFPSKSDQKVSSLVLALSPVLVVAQTPQPVVVTSSARTILPPL
jgi:hypothetical protein